MAARRGLRRARTLAWHDVVFGIATFDSAAEHALLQAAADTWLRMAEGADLLITTDGDDPRPDDEAAALRVRRRRVELGAIEVVVDVVALPLGLSRVVALYHYSSFSHRIR